MSEDAGEKTHDPTTKRLREAARNGDVLRSKDLATAAGVLGGAYMLKLAGPWLLTDLSQVMRAGLTWDRADLDDFNPGRLLIQLGEAMLPPMLAFGLATILLTLASQLVLSGEGRFLASNLALKGQRINPLSGLKRVFGAQGWIEAGKGLLKLGLLGAITWNWASGRMALFAALPGEGLSGQLMQGWEAITSLLVALGVGLVIIALFDFPIQWIRRRKRLKMSLQEIKDEHKESEGNPENKAAQRQRQRQMAMASVSAAMRKAQFVVTNPTHFAVAMTYDPELAPAPLVLAKGRGEKALAIRRMAGELDVPCLEFPALARSVYYTTRERQMIREELYGAVASVLAFVFSIRRGEKRTAPRIEVPVSVRFDADGRKEPPPPPRDAADR